MYWKHLGEKRISVQDTLYRPLSLPYILSCISVSELLPRLT